MTYDQVMQYINSYENDNGDILWQFQEIIGHEHVRPHDPTYNGSTYNVLVKWEDGSVTSEPLAIIAKDSPAVLAKYAEDNGLLDKPGWRRFRKLAKNQKKLLRFINQAKLRSFRTAPRYKYGFEVPRDYRHALSLDQALPQDVTVIIFI